MSEITIITLRRVAPCPRCMTGSQIADSCTACGYEHDPVPEEIVETICEERRRGRRRRRLSTE